MAIVIGDISAGRKEIQDIHDTLKTELPKLKTILATLKTHWQDEKSGGYITNWESIITKVESVANHNLPILDENAGKLDKLVHIYKA